MKKLLILVSLVMLPSTVLAYACCGDNYTNQHLLAYIGALILSVVGGYFFIKKIQKKKIGKMQFSLINFVTDIISIFFSSLFHFTVALFFNPFSIANIIHYRIAEIFGFSYYYGFSYVDLYDFSDPNSHYIGLETKENLLELLIMPQFWLMVIVAIIIKSGLLILWYKFIRKGEIKTQILGILGFITVMAFVIGFIAIWNLGFLIAPPGRYMPAV